MDAAVQQMWEEFRAAGHPEAELAGAFAFGDSPGLADELAYLVLNGPKRATAGLVLEFERDGEPLPRPGDHSIVLNGHGDPICVIRTTEVEVKPLSQVDDQFAWDEGEGDRSLTWWRRAHERYFTRQCEQLGVPFRDDLAVVFERFELVWPS
jgi:uncharacterized protein YhfF